RHGLGHRLRNGGPHHRYRGARDRYPAPLLPRLRGRRVPRVKERADAARNRQAILAAASTLFETAEDPLTVTMDDVAAAAGVGKGTLFRRFGDRTGLLRGVFDARIADLMTAIIVGPPP